MTILIAIFKNALIRYFAKILIFFYLCLFQVGLVMGVSWVCGFIASVADISLFWWLFIISSSLQGPLLLISIICSTQFKQLLSKKNENAKAANRRNCSGRPSQALAVTDGLASYDSNNDEQSRRRKGSTPGSTLFKSPGSLEMCHVNTRNEHSGGEK